jgi:CelD/BcsL family acetyltransferase involved in cellulose biosynthesis
LISPQDEAAFTELFEQKKAQFAKTNWATEQIKKV